MPASSARGAPSRRVWPDHAAPGYRPAGTIGAGRVTARSSAGPVGDQRPSASSPLAHYPASSIAQVAVRRTRRPGSWPARSVGRWRILVPGDDSLIAISTSALSDVPHAQALPQPGRTAGFQYRADRTKFDASLIIATPSLRESLDLEGVEQTSLAWRDASRRTVCSSRSAGQHACHHNEVVVQQHRPIHVVARRGTDQQQSVPHTPADRPTSVRRSPSSDPTSGRVASSPRSVQARCCSTVTGSSGCPRLRRWARFQCIVRLRSNQTDPPVIVPGIGRSLEAGLAPGPHARRTTPSTNHSGSVHAVGRSSVVEASPPPARLNRLIPAGAAGSSTRRARRRPAAAAPRLIARFGAPLNTSRGEMWAEFVVRWGKLRIPWREVE